VPLEEVILRSQELKIYFGFINCVDKNYICPSRQQRPNCICYVSKTLYSY